MNDTRSPNHTFESVRQPLTERNWQTGDEFLFSITEDVDVAREPLCAIPDPRFEQGWSIVRTDAETAAPGEIWRTTGAPNPKLVVIRLREIVTSAGLVFEVLPISFQHQFAGPFDYLIDREESPLGVGFMIETHMPIFTCGESLEGCIGELTARQWVEAQMLLRASFGLLRGDENQDARETARWVPQGHPITRGDDIRIRFREQERENIAHLTIKG